MAVVYSPGIIITNKKIHDGDGHLSTISNSAGRKDFIDTTRASLDRIKATPTGGRLLNEIDASGHKVQIYRAWGKTDGNSQGGSTADEMVRKFQDLEPDGTTVLHTILESASQDLSNRSAVKKFFHVGKVKPRFMNRDAISRLTGVSLPDLTQMEKGKKAIPPTVDAKLRSYLYSFLQPGKGCDCYVVFNHTRDNLSAKHKQYLPMSHTWEHRPPTIALGHELIHAWRGMTGMVLFDYGWEEEAMTVGLPPFSFMEYTENRLRIEYGNLAIRPDYKYISNKTDLVAGQKLGLDADNIWQGKQGALHSQQPLAMGAASRRAAMGYNDSDENEADDWD